MLPAPTPTPRHDNKVNALQKLGRANDAVQVIIWGTFGQFLLGDGYGTTQLQAPQWRGFTEWAGGQNVVGLSVLLVAILGLVGIFSLVLETDSYYTAIMWVFSLSVAVWCFTVAGFQTYAMVAHGAGNAGFWNWTLVGLFFVFSRLAITLSRGLK